MRAIFNKVTESTCESFAQEFLDLKAQESSALEDVSCLVIKKKRLKTESVSDISENPTTSLRIDMCSSSPIRCVVIFRSLI